VPKDDCDVRTNRLLPLPDLPFLPAAVVSAPADIKVREPDFAHMVATGRTRYEAPRFMTVNQAVAQLLEIESKLNEGGECGIAATAERRGTIQCRTLQ
jgi:hypothetical protein